ncbi:ABC transporter permease [Terracoccus luteus]|uniref:Peptide/nickel transport system permease protein n=1 Tax=Terracoccus luteus TaxID=53356 RepID=A0A839PPG5_9MICO|nr:ABC transporter permease [Terracoccus luteus]MBB2986188.1 peptide/nickel transport system permease protein [Terracoccus luteus]MCP2172222.1 peptide/nickel transport system permease protein [Terracoccus luteus]
MRTLRRVLSPAGADAGRSPWSRPLAVVGAVVIVLWVLVALAAPLLAPHDPNAQDFARLQPPGGDNLLGTDGLGRDVLSRILYGTRITLPLAVLLVVLATTVGTVLGAVAGYFGRWADTVVMRLADLVFAFPGIILAMAAAAALGPGLRNAVLALTVVMWPSYARVVRSMLLGLREAEFVSATRLLGASARRTLVVDLRPNVAGPVLVLAALEVGNAVLLLSGLSFLGLGAQPPDAEWGAMVSEGARNFDAWWIGVFPGLAILTVVLAFNFLGDTLRDALDPRTARALGGTP